MSKEKVAIGAAVMAIFQVTAKFLDMIALVVLAQILTPEDFGLVAIAMSVLLILSAVTDLPTIDVLIQQNKVSQLDIDSAFTANVMRGLVVLLILLIIAYPISIFYEDSRLILVTCALGLVPIGKSLESPMLVIHLREVNYRLTAQILLVGKVFGALLSIGLAVMTHSLWALIAGVASAALVSAAWSYVRAPYRPRIEFSGVSRILKFAGWVTVSRIIFTVNQQSDRFFIGHLLGKDSLGQYTVASEMSSLATYSLATPVMRPIFSGMSRIQADIVRLREAYFKSQQMLAMLIFPFGVGLAVLADLVVPLLLGSEWNEAKVVIWWLAPTVALQMLSIPVQAVAMARARPAALMIREGVALILRLPLTIWAAINFGLEGAAIARSLSGLVVIIFNMGIAQQLIGASILHQFDVVKRSLLSALIMAALMLLAKFLLGNPVSLLGQMMVLAGLILFGGMVYICTHLGLWRLAGCPAGSETFAKDMVLKKMKVL